MKKTFNQFETTHKQPEKIGWYNTDKGLLYWWGEPFVWSCRDDRISEEYPRFWYIELPVYANIEYLLNALKVIKNWSDEDDEEWEDQGYFASHVLKKHSTSHTGA